MQSQRSKRRRKGIRCGVRDRVALMQPPLCSKLMFTELCSLSGIVLRILHVITTLALAATLWDMYYLLPSCHTLNGFVSKPLKFIYWNLRSFATIDEGGALGSDWTWVGLGPFKKGGRVHFAPFAMQGHREKTAIMRKQLSPDIKFASTFALDFLASKTGRKKCLLVKLLNLWYSVIAVWTDQDSSFYTNKATEAWGGSVTCSWLFGQ